MIQRFRKLNDNLYRGSAPSIEDVIFLKKKIGINKIVSLDKDAGDHIDRACKLLDIKHVMCPIDTQHGKHTQRKSLLKFLKHDLYKLLMDDGPTYVHCIEGKDRTGMACAMFRCLYQGWTCDEALKEALKLGFGKGVPKPVVHLYRDIIQSACETADKKKSKKHKHIDHNSTDDSNYGYDIVSNERDNSGDYRDYSLGYWEQQSWSPWEDYMVREFPFASSYPVYFPEQYGSRVSEVDDSRVSTVDDVDNPDSDDKYRGAGLPQSGTWDTSTNGIMGAGPSLVGSGYV